MRTYYTLCTLEDDGEFHQQWGDYDRKVVADELYDYSQGGAYSASQLKIVKSGDDQAAIDLAIAELNRRAKS